MIWALGEEEMQLNDGVRSTKAVLWFRWLVAVFHHEGQGSMPRQFMWGLLLDKMLHIFSSIVRGWHNSPISGRSTERLSVTQPQE
jgi:hypothetical protein